MLLNNFYHIGIEVPDLQEAKKFYMELIGLELDFEERLPEKKLTVAFLKGKGCELELMCFDNSNEKNFAATEESHVQHISFLVDDIDEAMAYLKDKGIELESEEPISVFNGKTLYNTFNGPGGELLEIAEIKR
jgi:methylmalonyl-CoA epimerase